MPVRECRSRGGGDRPKVCPLACPMAPIGYPTFALVSQINKHPCSKLTGNKLPRSKLMGYL